MQGVDPVSQNDFVAEVKAKTGEPWPTQHFVTTYGDILIFKAALEAAGKADREAVAQALRKMNLRGGRPISFPETASSDSKTMAAAPTRVC